MLNAIDLFSGIGAFSYAFQGTFRTIAYCEIDAECRRVLKQNMVLGRLDKAPIAHDIRALHKATFPIKKRVDAIFAGFPCQDISVANTNGKGIYGLRSGLFWEIIRIIDEFDDTVNFVMLENVRNILKRGYRVVYRELNKRGFDVKYTIVSARQLGAPHKRSRVFIVARRRNPDLHVVNRKLLTNMWNQKGPPRVVEIPLEKRNAECKRFSMCGNSIVPHCIQYAYTHLVYGDPLPNKPKTWNIVLKQKKVVIRKEIWGTPYAHMGLYHIYKKLTERGAQMIINQVFYDVTRKPSLKPFLNPRFVEWLMGFPANYTKS